MQGGNDGYFDETDLEGNYPLHYACEEGNYAVVNYLLSRQILAAVSERNSSNNLPIHLMCKAGERKGYNKHPEYIESIWRLLVAYPEAVSNW